MRSLSHFSLVTIFLVSSSAFAAPDLQFENARAFLPLPGGRATAGYVDLKNETGKDLSIEVVSAEGFKAAEMHETFETEGKMGMRRIESLKLKPKAKDALTPGGKHIMLFDPSKEFKEGDSVQLSLRINGVVRKVSFKMIPRLAESNKETSHHH